MKLIPVILIFLSAVCFPQNLVSIFKDYLPPEVSSNKTFSNQISAALKGYSDRNPDLIYYYINFLNEKLGEYADGDYFLNTFPKIRKDYLSKFNNWVVKLQKEIIDRNADKSLTRLCIDFLDDYYNEDLKSEVIPDLKSRTDENLKDFFVVKFYLQDKEMRYNPDEDYQMGRMKIEQQKLSTLDEMIKHPETYSKSDLKNIIRKWYMFDNYRNDRNADLAVAIIKILKYYYSNANRFSTFEIGVGYSFEANYMFMTKNSYGTSLYSPTQVERKFTMNSIVLSLKYKIKLSEYLGAFNFFNVRLSAGYGLINSEFTGEKYGFWNTGVDGISNRSEIFEFFSNNIKLKNAEFVDADLSIPFFYITEFISLNLGAGMDLFFTNYELTYDYEYRKFESEFLGPKMITTETGNASGKKITSANIRFYPEFLLGIHPGKLLSVYLRATTRTAAVELGFGI